MNSKKLYYLLIGAICFCLISMVVGAYGINSVLSKKSIALNSLKAKSQALGEEQVILVKDKKDIQTYSNLGKIAKAVVPQDKNQAEAVRELANIAASNNISLASITFPASTLGSSSSSPTAQQNTTILPSPSVTFKAGKLSQLAPVKNIPGVYQLTITVQSDSTNPVPYSQFITFLSSLEHNRRTAQISGISITPNPKNPSDLSFSLVLNEYIKP